MDHLSIYKQMYGHLLSAVSCFENENLVAGSIRLGILLETLDKIIGKLNADTACKDSDENQETQKDIYDLFGTPSVEDLDKLRDCLKMFCKLNESKNK
jgi:hypothetical protein